MAVTRIVDWVLRIVDAIFKELGKRFAHMIKSRAWVNEDSGKIFSPGLVIVSLPGQLVNLGIVGYIQEFLVFIGASNMRAIFDLTKDLMKLETEYIFCNLSVLTTEDEFSQFKAKTSLREGSICILTMASIALNHVHTAR